MESLIPDSWKRMTNLLVEDGFFASNREFEM